MSKTPNEWWRVVKLAQLECQLARDTAINRYGFNGDGHMAWHCLKPWLNGADGRAVRDGIEKVLIPLCSDNVRWAFLVPELKILVGQLRMEPMEFLPTCTLCRSGT